MRMCIIPTNNNKTGNIVRQLFRCYGCFLALDSVAWYLNGNGNEEGGGTIRLPESCSYCSLL